MLVNLGEYLKHHAGQPRLVAWPRVKTAMSRETLYAKQAGPRGIFAEGVKESLREGDGIFAAHLERRDVVGPRGVRQPAARIRHHRRITNNTLAWLTIEGAGQKCEASLWFRPTASLRERVGRIKYAWAAELHRILA